MGEYSGFTFVNGFQKMGEILNAEMDVLSELPYY